LSEQICRAGGAASDRDSRATRIKRTPITMKRPEQRKKFPSEPVIGGSLTFGDPATGSVFTWFLAENSGIFGKVNFLSHFCCQESRNVFY